MNGFILDNQALPVNREKQVTIRRGKHDKENPYVMISRHMLRDPDLSLNAKGVLCYLLSLHDTWVTHPRQLAAALGIGKDKVYTILKELIVKGYATKTDIKRENGRFSQVIYEFYEEKQVAENQTSLSENPITVSENPDTENPDTENQTLRNKEESKDSKEERKKERIPSYKVSTETMAAEAAGVESGEPLKKPKKKKEASHEVKELTGKMLSLLKDNVPVYRPPDDLAKFYEDVGHLIEKEEQNPEILLKTFEWALQDTEKRGDFPGWQGIVAKNKRGRLNTSPAGIFRQHFTTIYAQMKSRPARKFAPGSDDDAALAAILEGKEGAL